MGDTIVDTNHCAPVVDIAVNANGTRLATASEDGTISIYTCPTGETAVGASPDEAALAAGKTPHSAWTLSCTLEAEAKGTAAVAATTGQSASTGVSCLAWAPLAFYSSALVACTEMDQQVTLWSENTQLRTYQRVYTATLPAPGCAVAWAPQEYGKLFAVGCADGAVVVFTGHELAWDVHPFLAHPGGCLGLSFAPFYPPGSLLLAPLESELNSPDGAPPLPIAPPRMASCGGRQVRIWTHTFAPRAAEEEAGAAPPESVWTAMDLPLSVEGRWRVVAWAPSIGLPFTYLAAGSEEGYVVVWRQDGPRLDEWQHSVLPRQPAAVTHLSWSSAGTFLLVSCANGVATMWTETPSGEFEMTGEVCNPSLEPE